MSGWIEAQNLGHHFDAQAAVFENLNFQIARGEFVTLLGPSGCGKSTLLRILGDLQEASQGKIQVPQAITKSFVFQEHRLLPWRSSLENTLLPIEIQNSRGPRADEKAKAESLLISLGLQNALEKFPEALSGGMKMRCALARSLILNPDLLLLDEPFAALDEHTRQNLQDELRHLFETQKKTVIFVTHSIEEACYLSDRIFMFKKDRRGLLECRLDLPKERNRKLREDIRFFEESSRIRKYFQAESV